MALVAGHDRKTDFVFSGRTNPINAYPLTRAEILSYRLFRFPGILSRGQLLGSSC